MNIAFIATEKLPVPAVRGGAIQIYLESVAPIIAKRHRVTVFSIGDPELPERETSEGVTYIRCDRDHYQERLLDELNTHRFDVIHLCNRPAWIASLKKAAPDSKFVLSVHNEMFSERKMSDEHGRSCIRTVEKIVTVSDYIGETIVARFPEAKQKTETVYSGVDLSAYHPHWTDEGRQIRKIMREKAGLEGKKIVLFVGRLSKVKGAHLLLQALPEIIEAHPDAVLVFVGSKWFGDDRLNHYVRHLYALGALNQDHVKFVKFVRPRDISLFYSMADLFVCASQWQEPLARVHYEAMAAGLPIITTRKGGNPEVIEEEKNGLVIERAEDPHEYARLIGALLNDGQKREQMGRCGRSLAEKKHGWPHVAASLQHIYESARGER